MNQVQKTAAPGLSAFAVSVYLLAVGVWLLLTGRIENPGFGKILRSGFRAPYRGTLTAMNPETGLCYVAPLPEELRSDRESASMLRLYEDGRELGPAHSGHDEIRQAGGGRFSHWGPTLYFSTSDGSDPRSNGRSYEVREVK